MESKRVVSIEYLTWWEEEEVSANLPEGVAELFAGPCYVFGFLRQGVRQCCVALSPSYNETQADVKLLVESCKAAHR